MRVEVNFWTAPAQAKSEIGLPKAEFRTRGVLAVGLDVVALAIQGLSHGGWYSFGRSPLRACSPVGADPASTMDAH